MMMQMIIKKSDYFTDRGRGQPCMQCCVCMGENIHIKLNQCNLNDRTDLGWADDGQKEMHK